MGPGALTRLLRKEQAVSAAINAALSAAFFALVFGVAERGLTMGAPDRFAFDFLPQGVMVSLMASLVPSLLVRARLRASGDVSACDGPGGAEIARTVLFSVLAGVASAGALMALAVLGPLESVPSWPALIFKILYGALLGLACTRWAIHTLFAQRMMGAGA